MGHTRFGRTPRTRNWQKVVSPAGAATADISAATPDASNPGLEDAASDQRVRLTRSDGSVEWVNPATDGAGPPGAIWAHDEEVRISLCVSTGEGEVRSELGRIFSGEEWPAPTALVEPFRRHAINVFDVYASAYRKKALSGASYHEALNQQLLPKLLRDLFGHEWDCSPGQKVVRILWQNGSDGRSEGREVEVVAGNDPDRTCSFYQLVSSEVEGRFCSLEPQPPLAPGESPGANLSNLPEWRYTGLSERHEIARSIKPYLEQRAAQWQFIYGPTAAAESDGTTAKTPPESPASTKTATNSEREVGPNLDSPSRTSDRVPPRRSPNLDISRERLALVDRLARELAIVKKELNGYCTADGLKKKHPTFTLWTLIEDSQIRALVDGEAFTPKAYAENLALSKYGLISRETLKKDRQKLRKADKAGRQ